MTYWFDFKYKYCVPLKSEFATNPKHNFIMKRIIPFLATALMLSTSCITTKNVNTPIKETSLIELMTGSFNSAEQAKADSTYYDITLQMYPIWVEDKNDWLYVEQAVTSKQEKPYRQRVYKIVSDTEGAYQSIIYTLNQPEDFIGKWKTPEYFDQFDASILKEREGCTVYLKKIGAEYSGATLDDNCKSTLRGASYATSIVTVKKDVIVSWDQGFDAKGKQVWGATDGGYVFKKIATK